MRKQRPDEPVRRVRAALRAPRVRRRATGSALLGGTLAVGLAVSVLTGAWSATTPHSAHRAIVTSPPPAPAVAVPGPNTTNVPLLTGERVRLDTEPNGAQVASVRPVLDASGRPVTTLDDTFQVGGDTYAVPGDAMPYLGRQLDPSLFDVSYLQRAGYAGAAELPLSITWRSVQHSPVPGLSTPSSGLRTTGTVTDGTRFAAALRDASASIARGTTGSTAGAAPASGPLAQVASITLGAPPAGGAAASSRGGMSYGAAASATGMPVRPAQPLTVRGSRPGTALHTLTIEPLDRAGQSAYALITVQNLDHLATFSSVTSAVPGEPLAVSVPDGRYAVEAIVYDLGQTLPLPVDVSFVPLPQIDVSRDTIVTADARLAQPIQVTVPRTASPESAVLSFSRTSADQHGMQGDIQVIGPGVAGVVPALNLYAVPTPAPAVGSLDFAQSWELVPPGTGLQGVDAAYSYSLDFASTRGVPTVLSHALTDGDLAVVHDGFAASRPHTRAYSAFVAYHGWSPLASALYQSYIGPFPVPLRRDDYVLGSGSTLWQQVFEPVVPTANTIVSAISYGPFRAFAAGHQFSVTWGASPTVPTPEFQDAGVLPGAKPDTSYVAPFSAYLCPVCRQGDVMEFNVPMSADADPTHFTGWRGLGAGVLTAPAGRVADQLRFYRDGVLTQLADASGQVFPMLPGRARYEIDWSSTVPTTWTGLATQVDSRWTFSSAEPTRPDRLPSYESCTPDVGAGCSYLPLVFASYDLGAGLDNTVQAPGNTTFTVTGYHEAGEHGPAVERASVSVSYDDGVSWTPASSVTSLGGGRFSVTVATPTPSASASYASLRVQLTDTAGDSLRQTIIRAFALTSASGTTSAHSMPGAGE